MSAEDDYSGYQEVGVTHTQVYLDKDIEAPGKSETKDDGLGSRA